MLLALGSFVLFGYLAYRPFAKQSSAFKSGLSGQIQRIKTLPVIGPRLKDVDLKKKSEEFFKSLPKRLSSQRKAILGVAQTALTDLALTGTTIAVAVFMLLNGPKIAAGASALVLDDIKRVRAHRLARKMLDAVSGYVTGNLLISFLASAVTAISLIAMGVPFVAVLTVVMFVLDLVPMVGATLGGIVVTAATFILDPHIWKTLTFVVIYVVYQETETHTLYPIVMGRTVKIGAFSVFLVTLAGAELAGVMGVLLAIPIGSILNVVVQDLLEERKGKALLRTTQSAEAMGLQTAGSLPTGERARESE